MADQYAAFVAWTRGELARAGMERVEHEGSVYWRNGAPASAGEVRTPTAEAAAPLVLIHGVNDQAGTWWPVVPLLAQRFRLLIPDLAGHGESEPHDGVLPLPLIVDRLHAIIERESRDRVTLVGNSMGGWVSMLYALAHRDRVERLVLEDASGMAWPLTVPLVAQSREDAVTMFRAVNGPGAEMPEWALDALLQRATDSPMLRVMKGNVLPHVLDGRLADLDTPTTLIWGADDGLLPVGYAQALCARIRDAKLHVIDGAAHIPHRQQSERFVECLTATF